MAKLPVINITDNAIERIRYLMEHAKEPVLGLRVGVKKGGCSGLSYAIDYAKEEKTGEEVVEKDGIKVFIEPAAILHLLGTEMDFVEEKLASRFVFNNPNAKNHCGCGESFTT